MAVNWLEELRSRGYTRTQWGAGGFKPTGRCIDAKSFAFEKTPWYATIGCDYDDGYVAFAVVHQENEVSLLWTIPEESEPHIRMTRAIFDALHNDEDVPLIANLEFARPLVQWWGKKGELENG